MSLSYTSKAKVDAATRKAVLADAGSIQRDWWCESFAFFDDPKAKRKLSGDSKLMLLGYTTPKGKFVDVDPEDDLLMAAREVAFIVQRLSLWSKNFEIDWLIEESEMGLSGTITDGKPDASTKKIVETFASMADAEDVQDEASDQRAAKILKKHKARNG